METGFVKMPNKLIVAFFVLLFLAVQASAQTKCDAPDNTANLPCVKNVLKLGKNEFEVRVYTKAYKNKRPTDRTFAVVHYNEQKGLSATKKVVSEDGGRLVEVISKTADGKARRYLHIDFAGQTNVCVDPNRIYSKLGIRKFFAGYPHSEDTTEDVCTPIPAEMFDGDDDAIIIEIARFGAELLKIVTNDNRQRFIVGIHNNVDLKLDVASWLAPGSEAKTSVGVFLANSRSHDAAADRDDFILVTNLKLFAKVLNLGEYYNIALQEDKKFLDENRATTDDGSMSIYFGTHFWGKTKQIFDYINIEAQGKEDEEDEFKARQTRAIRQINKLKL
jgi:hypothetical protein